MRRVAAVAAATACLLAVPLPALAHGIGGRKDLPVPLEFFLVGAAVVLLVSFGALAVLWPAPRLQAGPRFRGQGKKVPGLLARAAAGFGLAFFVLVVAAGLFGDAEARGNIAPVAVWVLFWLVIPFASVVVGNVWSMFSPWRTTARVLPLEGPAGAGPLGVWPAAVGFLAFAWMELVSGRSAEPRMIGIAAVGYFAYVVVVAFRVGADRAVASFDT
ncbi:MAG TPA: hypothetical protein VGB41_01670, partial [Acidimicrobiia bacterium]